MKVIDKNKLLEELKKIKQNLSASPIVVIEDVESLVESLEVKDPYLDKGQPQNRWKPSGEQISCLARAINRSPSRTDEKILGELLKQLNKQASE